MQSRDAAIVQHSTNLPTPRFPWQSSAGVCGMHGVFVGPSCPKCVTGVKPNA